MACLLLSAQVRAEEQPQAGAVARIANAAFDLVILRPVGLVVVAVGAAAFVPVVILSSPGGRDSIKEAADRFVIGPGKYVFVRPLGEF
jgi:hypothetical protein